MNKKLVRGVLPVILTIMMVMTLLPIQVFATGDEGGGSSKLTVTYHSNYPSGSDEEPIIDETETIEEGLTVRGEVPGGWGVDGYTFSGWFDSGTGGTKVSGTVTTSTNLYAQWAEVAAEVENDPLLEEDGGDPVVEDDDAPALEDEDEGFSVLEGEAEEGEDDPEGEEAAEFTVTFVVGDVTTTAETVDGKVDDPGIPATDEWPEGARAFLGWFADGDEQTVENSFDFETQITENITLTAAFSNQYMIKYKNADGIVVDTIFVSEGNTVPQTAKTIYPPIDPEGAIYHLAYWYVEGTANPEDPANAFGFGAANANITLVPYFTNTHSVVFISEGTQVQPAVVAAGAAVTQPANPTRAGYDFNGWATFDGTAYAPYNFSTFVTGDLTLYAQWTPQSTGVAVTVIYWLEKPDQPGEIADDPDLFAYYSSFPRNAVAGTPVTIGASATNFINTSALTGIPSYAYYAFAQSNSTTVLGNGNTVVNIYLKRTIYTLTFDLGSRNGTTTSVDSNYSGFGLNSYARTRTETETAYQRQILLNGVVVGSQGAGDNTLYSFTAKYEQNISENPHLQKAPELHLD